MTVDPATHPLREGSAHVSVLQVGGTGEVPPWIATIIQYSDVLAAILGLFIAYQAFRGYRRNDSRPMLFISLGFVLALGLPFAILLVSFVVPGGYVPVLGLLTQAAELVGLGAILYALWMPA